MVTRDTNTLNGAKLSIWVGNGASPEVFAAPCGLTTRKITVTNKTGEVVVFDCNNPDNPGWIERVAQSRDVQLSGNGLFDKRAFPTWRDWALTGAVSKKVRFAVDKDVLGYFEGFFFLTTFDIGGDMGGKATAAIALMSDGEVDWVAAS